MLSCQNLFICVVNSFLGSQQLNIWVKLCSKTVPWIWLTGGKELHLLINLQISGIPSILLILSKWWKLAKLMSVKRMDLCCMILLARIFSHAWRAGTLLWSWLRMFRGALTLIWLKMFLQETFYHSGSNFIPDMSTFSKSCSLAQAKKSDTLLELFLEMTGQLYLGILTHWGNVRPKSLGLFKLENCSKIENSSVPLNNEWRLSLLPKFLDERRKKSALLEDISSLTRMINSLCDT